MNWNIIGQVGYGVILLTFIIWFLKRTVRQLTETLDKHIEKEELRDKEILTLVQNIKDNIIEKYITKLEEEIGQLKVEQKETQTKLEMHLNEK